MREKQINSLQQRLLNSHNLFEGDGSFLRGGDFDIAVFSWFFRVYCLLYYSLYCSLLYCTLDIAVLGFQYTPGSGADCPSHATKNLARFQSLAGRCSL